jgi:hypothetical protein
MIDPTVPNRIQFAQDPVGYSCSGWFRWALMANANGGSFDVSKPPKSDDLKHPILWLAQAQAMMQAAMLLLRSEPSFDHMPQVMKGICDTQYCAVALMMVGYSLEVCLKAMIIIRSGVEVYAGEENRYMNHRLHKLADFMNDLNKKDLAILELLTHFVSWAGRYPDPGSKSIGSHEAIFDQSEAHQVTLDDVKRVAAKVMGHVETVVNGSDS